MELFYLATFTPKCEYKYHSSKKKKKKKNTTLPMVYTLTRKKKYKDKIWKFVDKTKNN